MYNKTKSTLPLAILLLFFTCSISVAAETEETIVFEPVYVKNLQPSLAETDGLLPGLDVFYYVDFFERDVRLLPKTESSQFRSFRGKPVEQLNHQFGKDKVFDSGTNRGVGMRLNGYLNFPDPGVYEMQALSNDGIVMSISGNVALSDPEQHSDRLSNIAHISIDQPGWYQVDIDYFQRKGTAALKLLWKVPGAKTFVPVPKQTYAHKAK
jgi:hypothetical protein